MAAIVKIQLVVTYEIDADEFESAAEEANIAFNDLRQDWSRKELTVDAEVVE